MNNFSRRVESVKLKLADKNLISLGQVNFMKKLHNTHLDKRCFIIANGPSLKVDDLDSLKNELTFACNKIYLSYENTQWRPTYYFVEDNLVATQNFKEISEINDSIKFVSLDMLNHVKKIKGSHYYRLDYNFHNINNSHKLISPISGFYCGGSVTFSMIQMAIYMGIKEIYLIGLDFNFNIEKDKIDKGYIVSQSESNHFHKSYRKPGEKWNFPKIEFQKRNFKLLAEYALKHNIKIFNCSRFTKLDTFELIDFDELMGFDK